MLIVLMGVSGSGKSTIGGLLAERMGWAFLEADDFHPDENRRKLAAGTPLDDADRWPWLEKLNETLRGVCDRGCSLILACSALKEAYRDRLTAGLTDVRFVNLCGTPELIRERLADREGHFASPKLLPSQFATLEKPQDAIDISVDATPPAIVERVARELGLGPRPVADPAASERLIVGNLFTAEGLPRDREVFEELARGREFRLERIVSNGQTTPEGEWYDQEGPEWVTLLSGRAKLRLADSVHPLDLAPGDTVLIPAHRRHRVEWTDPDGPSVWLAVHFAP